MSAATRVAIAGDLRVVVAHQGELSGATRMAASTDLAGGAEVVGVADGRRARDAAGRHHQRLEPRLVRCGPRDVIGAVAASTAMQHLAVTPVLELVLRGRTRGCGWSARR